MYVQPLSTDRRMPKTSQGFQASLSAVVPRTSLQSDGPGAAKTLREVSG
jgi:hypothetical protein